MVLENDLTEREREILRLVATGVSNKQIAHLLNISTNTVRVHLRNIFIKINVLSRTEATLYAFKHGIVSTPSSQPGLMEIPTTKTFWMQHRSEFIRWGVVLLVSLIMIVAWNLTHPRQLQPTKVTFPTLPLIITATPPPLWSIHADIPGGRAGAAAVTFEDQIYLIGGFSPGGYDHSVWIYNSPTNTWQSGSDKPTPVSGIKAMVLGERVYVPGGQRIDGSLSNALEVYDPRRNSWEIRAPLPVGLTDYGLTIYEGEIYLFGGWDGKTSVDTIYQYDPTSDIWKSYGTLPSARRNLAAAENGGKIYILGGISGGKDLTDNLVFYPNRINSDEKSWINKASIPVSTDGLQAVSMLNGIFVTGRQTGSALDAPVRIYQYLIASDEWVTLEASPVSLGEDPSMVALNNSIYVVGGNLSGKPIASCQSVQVLFTINIPAITK